MLEIVLSRRLELPGRPLLRLSSASKWATDDETSPRANYYREAARRIGRGSQKREVEVMKKTIWIVAAMVLLCSARGVAADEKKVAAKKMPPHVMFTPGTIQWVDAPPSLPPGAKMAVLEGDPAKPGYFAMRLKVPDGYKFMPHWHPNVERFTILSGTFHLGIGDTFSETGVHAMTAGTYGAIQPKVHHYGWTEGETEFQITTLGPWKRVYVNPADDPSRSVKK